MTITDMALPDAVVEAARAAFYQPVQESLNLRMLAAIRAALQAMLDNGMAEVSGRMYLHDGTVKITEIAIRLNADERKRASK